jgi:hypothetical protein
MNILLLGLATVTAVVAIGGETRRKESHFFKSLTGHGWIALICAVLALAAGIGKEILSRQESRQQQTKNDQLQGTVDSQVKQIGELQSALNEANEKIGDTRTKLVEGQRASQKTTEAIQAYVYNSLSAHNHSYLSMLGRMMGEATDGWLPQTQEEFFSRRAVNLICHNLNIDGEAPVIPKRPWYQFLQQQTKDYEDALAKLFGNHGAQMPPSLIRSISTVLISTLLWWPGSVITSKQADRAMQEFNKAYKINRPPVLCLGLEQEIEKSFAALVGLLEQTTIGEKQFSLTPRIKDKQYLRVLKGGTFRRGGNRFQQSDLDKWIWMEPRK